MATDDRVQNLITAAAARRAANTARRARYQQARQLGLAARHALKLAHLAQQANQPDDDPPEAA